MPELGEIFSLHDETCLHMVSALQHPKIYADKIKGVTEISEMSTQCPSYYTTVTFTILKTYCYGQNLTIISAHDYYVNKIHLHKEESKQGGTSSFVKQVE